MKEEDLKQYTMLLLRVKSIIIKEVSFESVEIRSRKWPNANFKAVIKQDELNHLLPLSDSYMVESRVFLEKKTVRITGSVDIGTAVIGLVDARGTLKVIDGRLIYFEPHRIKIGGIRVFGFVVNGVKSIMNRTPIFSIREGMPFRITDVVTEKGKLKIKGSLDLEKALEFSL